MAQYRIKHPYNPGYALPANVLAEPPGRHTLVTEQRPRRTFDPPGYIPLAWRSGFVLPEYIKAEPVGRGAISTHQARRRTIPMKLPDALGDTASVPKPGFPGDPFKKYGKQVSNFLMSTVSQLPKELRKPALYSLFDALEPGLKSRIEKRAQKYQSKGMSPNQAIREAIASSTSEGLAKEIIKLGKGKAPPVRSQLGLGAYDEAMIVALDGLLDSAKKYVGKAVKVVTAPHRYVAGKIASGSKKVYNWGKKALGKVKDLACGVLNNPLAGAGAGAAAAAYGAPPQAGAAGQQIGQAVLCSSGQQATTPVAIEEKKTPSWLLPAGIGAAGIAAVLIMRKK